MKEKEYCKCDGCGGYHPMDECEVVVIRMIKGRNCQIKSADSERITKPVQEKESIFDNPTIRKVPVVSVSETKPQSDFKEDAPGEGYHVPPKVMEEKIKSRKQIIPSGIASMMIPESHPAFNDKGAKEVRQF